jgi:Domain of unknown function (DUF397)
MKRNETYRKALASNSQGACVEVGEEPGGVGVGDTQDPRGPLMPVGQAAWAAFTRRLRAGA